MAVKVSAGHVDNCEHETRQVRTTRKRIVSPRMRSTLQLATSTLRSVYSRTTLLAPGRPCV